MVASTKTPSTPTDPADGPLTAVDEVLGLLGATGGDVTAVSHGTTVATDQLLEGSLDRVGSIANDGYEQVLEIARQSVPDGYGNSCSRVKPDRIVPADPVRTVGGRMDVRGHLLRPFDEDAAVEVARWFRDRGVTTRRRFWERLRVERPEQPVSDRGPGYARLAGGRTSSEVDWLV